MFKPISSLRQFRAGFVLAAFAVLMARTATGDPGLPSPWGPWRMFCKPNGVPQDFMGWVEGEGVSSDVGLAELIVCVVNREAKVIETWLGEMDMGQIVPVVRNMAQTISIVDRETRWDGDREVSQFRSREVRLPDTERRIVFLRKRQLDDEPVREGEVTWLWDRAADSCLWIEGDRILSIGRSWDVDHWPEFGHVTNGNAIVSLPRNVVNADVGLMVRDPSREDFFAAGPRMTEGELRARVIEAASRSDRRRRHAAEATRATDLSTQIAALASYVSEYEALPRGWRTQLAPPDPAIWNTVAPMLDNPQFEAAQSCLRLEGIRHAPEDLRKHIVENLEWRKDDEAKRTAAFMVRSPAKQLLEVDQARLRIVAIPRSFLSFEDDVHSFLDVGLSQLFRSSDIVDEFDDYRIGRSRVAVVRDLLTLSLLPEGDDEVCRRQREKLAALADYLDDNGPVAKALDKDIPFAHKLLGPVAGAYVLKHQRAKTEAPVEAPAPLPRPASESPPVRTAWPMTAAVLASLLIGGVIGRLTAR